MSTTRSLFSGIMLGAMLLTLTACGGGGQSLTFNGNPPESSISEASSDISSLATASSVSAISSSAASLSSSLSSSSGLSSVASNSSLSSSSTVPSSAASISSSSSSSAGPTAAQLYVTLKCGTCHGANGEGVDGDLELLNCGDCSNLTKLTDVIDATMPQISPGPSACNRECSAKLAQLIVDNFAAISSSPLPTFLKSEGAATNSNSLLTRDEFSCGIAYSSYDVRPLTRQEYSAAIWQLTGVDLINDLGQSTFDTLPPDNIVTQYFNNPKIVIDQDTQQSYNKVATNIAEQLYTRNFAGVIDCNGGSESCYSQLIRDFGCKIFRRPLTDTERSDYLALYTANITDVSAKNGAKKVIDAMLSSSQFIYRSHLGLSLIEQPATATIEQTMASAPSLLDSAKNISIYNNMVVATTLTGNDLLEVHVKGSQSVSGLWPTMRVQIGQATFVDILLDHSDTKTYRFHLTGFSGSTNLTIANQQTGAPLEYQAGQDLIISNLRSRGMD